MAYAAALSVMQKLEYLLPFSYMILRIKKLQIEMLDSTLTTPRKLAQPLDYFSSFWKMDLMEVALIEANSFEFGSGKFFLLAWNKTPTALVEIARRLISDIYHTPPESSGLISSKMTLLEMLEKIHDQHETTSKGANAFAKCYESDILLAEGELDKYFTSTQVVCTEISDHISSMGSKKFDHDTSSKLQDLCRAVDMLKTETTFFRKETMKIEGLCQNLDFLLAFLKDSANTCKNHGEVKCFEIDIRNAANRAEDIIEERLLGASFESKLRKMMVPDICALVQTLIGNIYDKEDGIIPSLYSTFVQTLIGNIYDKEHGIVPSLYSTFVEIDSIKRKVTTFTDETLGIRTFLPGTVSNNGPVDGLIKEDIVVRLDDITEEIVDRLTGQPSGLEIFSITGMGGCGKTTLARKVFDHPFTVYHFYCRVDGSPYLKFTKSEIFCWAFFAPLHSPLMKSMKRTKNN